MGGQSKHQLPCLWGAVQSHWRMDQCVIEEVLLFSLETKHVPQVVDYRESRLSVIDQPVTSDKEGQVLQKLATI